MSVKIKDVYLKFKVAADKGAVEESRQVFAELIDMVRAAEAKVCELTNKFWKLQSAGNEEEAQKVWDEREAYDLDFFSADPLEVGGVKDCRIKESGALLIHRFKDLGRDVFDVDLCRPSAGWEQYDTDQDAYCHGVWVNKQRLMAVSYTEGDIYIIYCLTEEVFNAEIAEMNNFYGEGCVAKTIGEEGTTIYRQNRDDFFIS